MLSELSMIVLVHTKSSNILLLGQHNHATNNHSIIKCPNTRIVESHKTYSQTELIIYNTISIGYKYHTQLGARDSQRWNINKA